MTTENTTQVPETTPDETSAPSTVDDTATIDRATFDDLYAQVTGLLSAWGDLDVEGQRVDAAGLIFEQLEWLEDRIHYLRRTLATVLMEPTADSFKGHGLDSGVDYAEANPWRGLDVAQDDDDDDAAQDEAPDEGDTPVAHDAAQQGVDGLAQTYVDKIKQAEVELDGARVCVEDAECTIAYYTGKLDGLRGRPGFNEDTATEGQDTEDDAHAAAQQAVEGLEELGLVAVTQADSVGEDAPQGDDEAPEAPEEARR